MKNSMPLRRHHDDNYWDRVLIEAGDFTFEAFIVPRFKTSGLSGDEWRISVKILLRRGNREILVSRSFHRMNSAMDHSGYFVYDKIPEALATPSALLVVERKGHVLMSETRPTLGDALLGLSWHVITANEGRPGVTWNHLTAEQERKHCQQVGCQEPPGVAYRLKKLQVSDSGHLVEPEFDFVGQFVWYCHEHAERGNAGLEDCDSNFEVVPMNEEPAS